MMTKTQKIIINCILILGTYVIPLYILSQNYNNYSDIEVIQKVVFIIFFFGAVILTYLNHKNKHITENLKWLWVIFEIIGTLGILYSVVILYLIFSFSRGIGF